MTPHWERVINLLDWIGWAATAVFASSYFFSAPAKLRLAFTRDRAPVLHAGRPVATAVTPQREEATSSLVRHFAIIHLGSGQLANRGSDRCPAGHDSIVTGPIVAVYRE